MADQGGGDGGLPSWAKAWVGRATGGIVGKIAAIGVAAFVAMGVVAYSLKNGTGLAGVVVVGAVFLYAMHRLLSYAEKHPEPASMEGRDYLAWRTKQAEIAGSNQPAALPPPEANVAPPQIVGQAQGPQGQARGLQEGQNG